MNRRPLICQFPGQGSQFTSMGKDLSESLIQKYFSPFMEACDFDYSEIVETDKIHQTEFTQPLLTGYAIALFENFCDSLNLSIDDIDFMAGHSVGEYAALTAAGVFDFHDVLKLTQERGRAMQSAVPLGQGGMAAVLRVPIHLIEKAIAQTLKLYHSGVLEIANDNTNGQTVIAGTREVLEQFEPCLKSVVEDFCQQSGEKIRSRVVPLQVSAPFHTTLMTPAALNMEDKLKTVNLNSNQCAYISNVDALLNPPNTTIEVIFSNLVNQINNPVRWRETIEKYPENSVVIEIGAGSVLTGMLKRERKDLDCFSWDELRKDSQKVEELKQLLAH